MTTFNKWIVLKTSPLLIVFIAMVVAPVLQAEATMIEDLRIGVNKGYVRMVLEFDRPLNTPPSVSINRNRLHLTLTGIISNLSALQTREYLGGDITSLDVSNASEATHIDAVFSFQPAEVKTFSLADPHRFIIDAYRPRSTSAERPPIEEAPPMVRIEETVSLSPPNNEPEEQASIQASPSSDEVSMMPSGVASSTSGNTDDHWRLKRFQQRLIAALIVVTSIIVIMLLYLIWMESGRKRGSGGQT